MAKRRSEIVAASLLSTWTDSDTAMQIVGSSLGVFGAGQPDPTIVLSNETPLRNALFDVLLSLVEGGAVEMRPADDGRYAFRWRAGIAEGGLSREGPTTIDVVTPSPYSAELTRARAERDEALERADFWEALAAEREQLHRLERDACLTDTASTDRPELCANEGLVDEMHRLFLENPQAVSEGWRAFFADDKPNSTPNNGP